MCDTHAVAYHGMQYVEEHWMIRHHMLWHVTAWRVLRGAVYTMVYHDVLQNAVTCRCNHVLQHAIMCCGMLSMSSHIHAMVCKSAIVCHGMSPDVMACCSLLWHVLLPYSVCVHMLLHMLSLCLTLWYVVLLHLTIWLCCGVLQCVMASYRVLPQATALMACHM